MQPGAGQRKRIANTLAALLLGVTLAPQISAKAEPPGPPAGSGDQPTATRDQKAEPTSRPDAERAEESDAAPKWYSTSTEAWPEHTYQVDDLPAPPSDLRDLVRRANLTFVFYDADQYRRKYPGETRFSVRYRIDANFRWKLQRVRGRRWVLLITPELGELNLAGAHRILLPAEYASDDLYSKGLTRHELDHVRISSDPRYAKRFARRVREELRKIEVPSHPRENHDQRSQEEVQKRVEQIFRETLELMRIRYQELDRVTDHGGRALPEAFFQRETDVGNTP